MGLIVGIDASRNRSGGARGHLVGILRATTDPGRFGISEVHVWSYRKLIDALPDASWLIKHSPKELEGSLFEQAAWQLRSLAGEARRQRCDIMLNTDAGTVGRFRPAVVMSRDMLSYEPGEMQRYGASKAWLRLFALRYVQAWSMRRAEGVIFLTRYAAQVIQKTTGKLPVMAVIPHGIGESFRRDSARPNAGLQGRPVRCLYVSNTAMYKHQWHVVRAIRQLRDRGYDIELRLAGGGSGKAQQLLDAEIARSDPEGRFVKEIGFVPHAGIPALLDSADVFIFASSCENMPNTLVEGMAAGLPIACSNRGPMPEVLRDGGVYFDPEQPSSIATAVEQLLVDDSARARYANRALTLAAEYSWARCANETWTFLSTVLGSRQ